MSLTTVAKVQKLLGSNYGPMADGTLPDLLQFIDSANSVVTSAASLAVKQRGITLSPAQQELIERWLAAYFYCHLDPLKTSKSTEGASSSYVASQSLEGEGERYKRGAIEMDPSGMVHALLNRAFATGYSLGRQC